MLYIVMDDYVNRVITHLSHKNIVAIILHQTHRLLSRNKFHQLLLNFLSYTVSVSIMCVCLGTCLLHLSCRNFCFSIWTVINYYMMEGVFLLTKNSVL